MNGAEPPVGEANGVVAPPSTPKPRPKRKRKKRKKKMATATNVRTSFTGKKTLEEALPPEEERPKYLLPEGAKTAMVKLKVDYWPSKEVQVIDGAPGQHGRLLAGMTVELPYEEAKTVVGRGVGDVVLA